MLQHFLKSSLVVPLVHVGVSLATNNAACTFPQPCWPSDTDWAALNDTLSGGLVRALPPAAPCHVNFYDEAACATAAQNWNITLWRAQQPGGYHDTAWENGDTYCNIDNAREEPCQQGLVPIYVPQVKSVEDVQTAVRFAKDHKLATRVKGASHDFLGRSSGNGTFGIQTINLKSIEFNDSWTPAGSPEDASTSTAVTVSAGEHWYYVYKAADEHGVIVVGGASYTVGAAGGWALGGGHSHMSPQYGLGVDNVLEVEIVTPDGELQTVNEYQNPDLFWALRGGGAGFGVVTKITYRTHPAITAISAFLLSINYTEASHRGFLQTYLGMQPALSAANFSGYSYPNPTDFLAQLLVHNSDDLAGANATLKPLYDFAESETANGRPVTIGALSYVLPSIFSMFPDAPENVSEGGSGYNAILGSRLLPTSAFEGEALDKLVDWFARVELPMMHLVGGGKVSTVPGDAVAANPSWRNAIHHIIIPTGWDTGTSFAERDARRAELTQRTQELAALVPGFGCYPNEADRDEPNWREAFWGSNYPRLLDIKRRIDPQGLFTCIKCVGYED